MVTEKIHGANFCILTDGKIIKYAKRKEILAGDEDFFGHRELVKELKTKILSIFESLQKNSSEIKQVSIYGEIFGGEYPHPDVKPNRSVKAVQTGIYYSPNIEFIVFDIAYLNKNRERKYIDYEELKQICTQVNILYTRALFIIGKYREAFAYNIEFTTTIPASLKLPPLEIANKAEGIVIKPAKFLLLDTVKGKIRPVIKKKIAQFAEDNRFHQAKKWNYKNDNEINNDSGSIEQNILSLVTENRLSNVLSKVGRIETLNKKKKRYLLNLYREDVLEAFREKWGDDFEKLETGKKEKIIQLINAKSQKIINHQLFLI